MNILLVEDETRVADFLRRGFKGEGWSVDHSLTGEAALDLLAERRFDVAVLDLMLPGISGRDVCQRMRARRDATPVLILTAMDSTEDCVSNLRVGADDYLTKPFDFEELIARIEALHRRAAQKPPQTDTNQITFGGLVFDPASFRTTVDGTEVELSVKERDLLVLFLSNPRRVLSRERILNAVWDTQEDPLTNVVDVYVGRLRRKIEPYGDQITTLRGIGYRFI
jgi:DNA-binding response OmpR family regulator